MTAEDQSSGSAAGPGPAAAPPYRVVQWATGNIGAYALRAVIGHPDMILAGVYASSPGKAGKDAGDLCGAGPTGIAVTGDADEILALGADCVLYMPLLGDVGDLCRLLASGANVVTTAGVFHHPPSLDPAVRAQVEAACQRGGSSIHSTGSSPGFISEAVPLVLTSIQRRLDALIIEEFADLSARDTPELLFGLMGFGQPATEMDPRRVAHAKMSFGPSLRQVAGALSIPLDDVTASGEVATARRAVRIAAGPLAAGTVAAQRLTVSGLRDGQPVLSFRATWYCTPDLDPAWDTRVSGWHLTVDGDAPLDIDIRFPVPLDQMASVFPAYTANRAVNAVPYVCAAPPGIHTTADLPQIVARLG
jgi:2,4-diaminopentanoate dehydrogenase